MGRSGQLEATNDPLIFELLKDELYQVLPGGTILTLITRTGKKSAKLLWRACGSYSKTRYGRVSYRGKVLQIHRVIWARFGSCPLEPDLMINHKDGNPGNNAIANLELGTQGKNNLHSFRVLKRPPVWGNVVLSWEIVRGIRFDQALGFTNRQLREKYKIESKGHISQIVNQKIWVEAVNPLQEGASL